MSVPELETRHEAEVMDPVYRSVPSLAGMDWLIRLEHAWPALATCVSTSCVACIACASRSRVYYRVCTGDHVTPCSAGPGGTSTAGSPLCATSLQPVLSMEVSCSFGMTPLPVRNC